MISRSTATFRTTPAAASSRPARPAPPGGHLGLVEALRQVTGQTLGKAVPGARRALASGFGMINYDQRPLCAAAAVIEGASR